MTRKVQKPWLEAVQPFAVGARSESALGPSKPANTIRFHYGKHHRAYVDNFNKFGAGTEFAEMPLDEIIRATEGKPDLFHNTAQV